MTKVIDIIGGGCAGFSLAKEAKNLKKFKVNIYTGGLKNNTDHYWGFWKHDVIEKSSNNIEKIWYNWKIITSNNEKIFYSKEHPYCVIRKKNWLDHSKYLANKFKVNIINKKVIEKKNNYFVDQKKLDGNFIFDSRLPNLNDDVLLQHFLGIEVECKEEKFDENTAILMDFRCDQSKGIHFIYFLPFSKKRALVESTLFSKNVEKNKFYLEEIKKYLKKFYKINKFLIKHKETGVIPMSYVYVTNGKSISIGTRGGATKPSSGYTFHFIQSQIKNIVNQIKMKKKISNIVHNKFDLFMDKIFLKVIQKNQKTVPNLFYNLTENLTGDEMAKFMSGKSNFNIWFKVILKLPKLTFLIALINITIYG